MPPIERVHLHQKAVYWEWLSVNAANEVIVDTPIEISLRWIEEEVEALASDGTNITTSVTVVAKQDLVIDSLLWLGTLEDWYGVGSAGDMSGVLQLATFKVTPDLKKRNYRRTGGLVFYKGVVP